MLSHARLSYARLSCAVLSCAVPCCGELYCAAQCYAVLCYLMRHHAIQPVYEHNSHHTILYQDMLLHNLEHIVFASRFKVFGKGVSTCCSINPLHRMSGPARAEMVPGGRVAR